MSSEFQIKATTLDSNIFSNSIEEKIKKIGISVRNITNLAKNDKLPPLTGREQELKTLIQRLLCVVKPNTLMVGLPGVGKTSLIEGLGQFLANSNNIHFSRFEIIEISCGSLLAGTSYRGDFEKKFIQLLDLLEENPQVIAFFDEAHLLSMTGDEHGGGMDALNLMKPYLLNNRIRTILATTPNESKNLIKDGAFTRRFFIMEVASLGAASYRSAFFLHAKYLAKKHGLPINSFDLAPMIEEFINQDLTLDQAIERLDGFFAETRLNSMKIFEEEFSLNT